MTGNQLKSNTHIILTINITTQHYKKNNNKKRLNNSMNYEVGEEYSCISTMIHHFT